MIVVNCCNFRIVMIATKSQQLRQSWQSRWFVAISSWSSQFCCNFCRVKINNFFVVFCHVSCQKSVWLWLVTYEKWGTCNFAFYKLTIFLTFPYEKKNFTRSTRREILRIGYFLIRLDLNNTHLKKEISFSRHMI